MLHLTGLIGADTKTMTLVHQEKLLQLLQPLINTQQGAQTCCSTVNAENHIQQCILFVRIERQCPRTAPFSYAVCYGA